MICIFTIPYLTENSIIEKNIKSYCFLENIWYYECRDYVAQPLLYDIAKKINN